MSETEKPSVNELAEKLVGSLPEAFAASRTEIERNFKALLASAFERMDLVTREEFDIQRRVLERSREKLNRLEAELARREDETAR